MTERERDLGGTVVLLSLMVVVLVTILGINYPKFMTPTTEWSNTCTSPE